MDSVEVTKRQVIRALQAAGAGLLSGTDGPDVPFMVCTLPGFTLHRELAALVWAGLTPYQALATSTRNVAAYFGTLDESGTVAVGKRADLVLLDGNPLVDISQTMHIAGVMLNGRWLSRATLDRRLAADRPAWVADSTPPSYGPTKRVTK
jgi:imidazolonepropionase-like amidohydrolase